jgi:hypothetical protein
MNPYSLLASLIACIALAVGGYFYGRHVEALAFDAYRAQQTAVAEKAAAQSQAAARTTEEAAEQKLNQVSASYQEQINDLQKTRDSLAAAVDSGNKRLYVHVAGTCHAGVPASAAGGSGDHGASTAELSSDTANQLIDLAARADAVAAQLAAAQQVIIQDRLTINGQ